MFILANFYKSKEWMMFRADVINKRINECGEIICSYCSKPIVKQYDCIAHHKKALTENNVNDYSVSLNPDNIELVHHACHNKLHNKFGNQIKHVYLVYGSPLSGKSSYVSSVQEQGDLIVDIDNIWQCVSGCERYVKPARLNNIVFGLRDELLNMVKMRRGRWNNAYILGGYPYKAERERLINSLDAEEIFINTNKEECLKRLENTSDRDKEKWTEYINSWWNIFNPTPLCN